MSAEPNYVVDGAPAIVHSAREQWLLRRRSLVTASDAAAILGLDPNRRPGDVYAVKLGLVEDEETWPMKWGTAIQGAIGAAYSEHTGRVVRVVPGELPELTMHPDLPWLAASLDGDVEGSDRMPAPAAGAGSFEAKASSLAHTWGEEVPETFQIQNTVQSGCAVRLWGSIGAFVSLRQPLRVQDIVFDRELFDLMVPGLEDFHRRLMRREPPVETPDWWSSESVRRVWWKNDGSSKVLDSATAAIVRRWRGLKAARKRIEDAEEEYGKRIRLALEGAAFGFLPEGHGGGGVALSNVKETVVAAHKKAAHTRLLDKQPKGGR